MTSAGLRPAHARTVWRALYQDARSGLSARDDFLPPLRRWVAESVGGGRRFGQRLPVAADERASEDGRTRKLVLELDDGERIETVVMGYPGRFTACLSTQAGCAMGCRFCATGQSGFRRHLRVGEIVAQAVQAQRVVRDSGERGCAPRAHGDG